MNELVSAFRWASAWLVLVSAVGAGCSDVNLHNEPRRAATSAAAAPAARPTGAAARAPVAPPRQGAVDDDADEAVGGDEVSDQDPADDREAARPTRPAANGSAPGAATPHERRLAVGAGARGANREAADDDARPDGPGPLRARGFPRVDERVRGAVERPTGARTESRAENQSARAADGEASTGNDSVRVRSVVVTRGIANRMPVGSGRAFGANDGTPVYTYVEAENPGAEPATLVFSWRREGGRAVGGQRIEVPASTRRWRTWALTRNARQAGSWTAEVRTADGRLVGSQSFVVEP